MWYSKFQKFKASCDTVIGLFASSYLRANTPVMEYCGDRMDSAEADLMSTIYQNNGTLGDSFAEDDEDIVIEATFIGTVPLHQQFVPSEHRTQKDHPKRQQQSRHLA